MIHFLKQWPQYFEQIRLKRKTFEIRKDDRGFMLGDQLCLEEWIPLDESLPDHAAVGMHGSTGRFLMTGPIPYIMRGPSFGLAVGHVIMSIVDIALMEAPAGHRTLTRADVEAYMERVRTIQQYQGSLNKSPPRPFPYPPTTSTKG